MRSVMEYMRCAVEMLAMPGRNKRHAAGAECPVWWSERIINGKSVMGKDWDEARLAMIMAVEVLNEPR